MLIKFFPNGKGGGAGPVEYLTARTVLAYDDNRDLIRDASGHPMTVTREPLPEVLRGDPQGMIDLIDACPHQWSYRAGVVSFAREDAPTEEQQQKVIGRFEEIAFAGLNADRYACLWVRHTHEDRVELHFCTPRMELHDGRSLNIAPPGYERAFDSLRDLMNKTHGWADPMDAERVAEVKPVAEAPHRAEGRDGIQSWIRDQISMGLITDRTGMIDALTDAGFEVPRAGKNYLTVKDPGTEERWRLKGEIFHENWKADTTAERETERGHGEDQVRERRLDRHSIAELQDRFETHCQRRAAYHRERYGTVSDKLAETIHTALESDRDGMAADREAVADNAPVDRTDCDGDLAGAQDTEPELFVARDQHDRATAGNLSDPGQRADDAAALHARRDGRGLHSDRGRVNNGWSDAVRTRVTELRRTVDGSLQDIGAGIKRLRAAYAHGTRWVAQFRDRIGEVTALIGRNLERLDADRLRHSAELATVERQHGTRPESTEAPRDTLTDEIRKDNHALRH